MGYNNFCQHLVHGFIAGEEQSSLRKPGLDRRHLICGVLLTAALRCYVCNRDSFPIFYTEQSAVRWLSYRSLLKVHPQHQYQTVSSNKIPQTIYAMARLSFWPGTSLCLSMLAKAYATPSPLSLKTDVTILFNNDLLG